MMLVLHVVGMSSKQVALHQRDTDAQKEQQDGDRTHDGPPEIGIRERNKEIQSPPEEHFTKVVRMARKRPQSIWNYLISRSRLAAKALHLEICRSFDEHSSQGYQGSYDVQPGQLGIAVAESRP